MGNQYVAQNLASIIANQALTIGQLREENENLKTRNAQLQESNTALRKEVNAHESSTDNTDNRQKHSSN